MGGDTVKTTLKEVSYNMRALVESLRRLYKSSRINKEKVDELFKNGKITEEEYNYILGV